MYGAFISEQQPPIGKKFLLWLSVPIREGPLSGSLALELRKNKKFHQTVQVNKVFILLKNAITPFSLSRLSINVQSSSFPFKNFIPN